MKNLFNRIISLICAVTLIICALSVCAAAEEASATPTDLQEESVPAQPEETVDALEADKDEQEEDKVTEQKEDEDYADESSDSPVESVEIIITRTMTLGESWNGVTGTSRLVVLKLDISKAQTVHMIVEGRNTWASVQKSDRIEENPRTVLTDPETRRAIITWEAEQGSYLITIGPEAPNPMAKAQVTFLDDEAYAAWEEEQEPEVEETEEKPETEEEKPEDPAEDTETEDNDEPEAVFELPADRSVKLKVTWDNEHPDYGDVAHFSAVLHGYDNIEHSLQWQNSIDGEYWTDVEGATEDHFDIIYTEENGDIHWRVMVFVILPEENN